MSNTVKIPSHVIVTIKRPNGAVEQMDYTAATKRQVRTMTQKMVVTINKAMAAAGRGEIIAFENILKEVAAAKPTAADLAKEAYIRQTNAVYRMSAGGERCDQISGIADGDATPAHKLDND